MARSLLLRRDMRLSSVIVSVIVCVVVFAARPARAGGPSDVGAYGGWELTGWFPHGRLAPKFEHKDNGAQFALIAGVRWHHVAVEVWNSPAMQSGIAVKGVDAKLLLPLGRYLSTYARLRLAYMTVDLDPYETDDARLRGFGGGEAIGLQANFAGRLFGVLIPAWFAAPFGPHGTGGIFLEFGHERFALGIDGGPTKSEGFWRFAYGLTWGGGF